MPDSLPFQFTRRRFAFWIGFGLFNLAEALGSDRLDDLAAAAIRATDSDVGTKSDDATKHAATPEHWTTAENNLWRWFERENLVEGLWKHTGITRPTRKDSGQPAAALDGYLDDSLVPEAVRNGAEQGDSAGAKGMVEDDAGRPNPMRRARHGRPPSRWLRSLKADELRIWLKKIDVPEAGVEGMTFWDHLTRDHYFNAKRIAGLTESEQAKLHAAAHYGY